MQRFKEGQMVKGIQILICKTLPLIDSAYSNSIKHTQRNVDCMNEGDSTIEQLQSP